MRAGKTFSDQAARHGRVIHERFRAGVFSIKDPKSHRQAAFTSPFRHQFLDAIGAIHKTLNSLPALARRGQRLVFAVHRHHHQKTDFRFALRPPSQIELAADGRIAAFRGLAQDPRPSRIGPQVKTDHGLSTFRVRLKINDGHVVRPLTRRAHAVVGQVIGLNRLDMGDQFVGPNKLAVAHPQHAAN